MKGKLMKTSMGGSGGAVWEDKYLSAFWGNAQAFYTLSWQVFKLKVEKIINRSKMSVEKTLKPRNFLCVMQWCLYEYLATTAGSCRLRSIISVSYSANAGNYLFFNLFLFFCFGMLLKFDQDQICFQTFKHLHILSERTKLGWAVILMFIDCAHDLISIELLDTIKMEERSWVTMIPHPRALRWVWGQEGNTVHRPTDRDSQMMNDVISERSL